MNNLFVYCEIEEGNVADVSLELLTQADYVFIIDPWWNPAAESQAIARAHRIGQDKQVIAYRFITQNSIEEKILHLQDEKRKLAETFVTDSEPLPILSNEQWVDLL